VTCQLKVNKKNGSKRPDLLIEINNRVNISNMGIVREDGENNMDCHRFCRLLKRSWENNFTRSNSIMFFLKLN
jgi:hypothetical protein